MKYRTLLLTSCMLFANSNLSASPTSNEFIPCKKLAVAVLEHCLDKDKKHCWKKSKTKFQSCRKEVIESHAPHSKALRRAAEEEKRKEEAMKEKLKKSKDDES